MPLAITWPASWKVAVSVHGPGSGFVRMNSQFCLPSGTFGSLVVVAVQAPSGSVPWPGVQITVIAKATPASTTSVARIVTTATPVFVKRRRKRLMTLSLPATQAVSSYRGSLGVARYQRPARNARTTERGSKWRRLCTFRYLCLRESCMFDRAGCSSKTLHPAAGQGLGPLPLSFAKQALMDGGAPPATP